MSLIAIVEEDGEELVQLHQFMKRTFCDEALEFVLAIRKVSCSKNPSDPSKIEKLKREFIVDDAPMVLNIDQKTKDLIMSSTENSLTIFANALQEMIFIIESDILPRYRLENQSCISSISDGNSTLKKRRRFSLINFPKTKPKTVEDKITITMSNILNVHTITIIDRSEKLSSLVERLLEYCKLSLPYYDIFCNNEEVSKESTVQEYISKLLVVEYRIIFYIDLPNGRRIGTKVDGFKTIKAVLPGILLKFGYRFKSFNFRVENSPLNINPSDYVKILDGQVIKMEFKHSIFYSTSTERLLK